MIIHVTQEDIQNGEAIESTSCPIALALQRTTGCVWAVGPDAACRINKDGTVGSPDIDLPQEARDFIYDYDGGRPVEPFSFEFPREEVGILNR